MQGITVEVGRAHFETEKTRFTILDAPVRLLLGLLGLAAIVSKWYKVHIYVQGISHSKDASKAIKLKS